MQIGRRQFIGSMAAAGTGSLLGVPASGRVARVGLVTDTHVGTTMESCVRVRAALGEVCGAAHVPLLMAKPRFTGDNGAMVAALAYYRQNVAGEAAFKIDVSPSLQVG